MGCCGGGSKKDAGDQERAKAGGNSGIKTAVVWGGGIALLIGLFIWLL